MLNQLLACQVLSTFVGCVPVSGLLIMVELFKTSTVFILDINGRVRDSTIFR